MLQDPEKEYISKRSTHLQGCKLIKKKRRTLLLKTASFGGWGEPPISHLEGGVGEDERENICGERRRSL